jgi:hypothetical protein
MLNAIALLVTLMGAPDMPSNPAAVATFVPVCRDGRGAWDRRACRHAGRADPHRLILAQWVRPGAASAIG